MEVKILSREHGMADVQVSLPGSELTKAIDAEFEKRRQAPDFNLPHRLPYSSYASSTIV